MSRTATRLAAAAAHLDPAGSIDLGLAGAFVERVEGALSGLDPAIRAWPAESAASDGAAARVPDDGAWVWRAEPPLPATGSGPLDGWRLGVKDLIDVAGHPVRGGSAARAGAPAASADAPVVATLRAAGAVIVGATKLHEFAFGVTGRNATDGTAANPAAPGRVPGGSSSGSAAAVAAGEADVALGTDTGGSCRIPAACCAVVGFKPSFGSVSTAGVLPLSPSLDHVGWLSRTVGQAVALAAVLGVVEGWDRSGGATGSRPIRRIGVHRRGLAGGTADGGEDPVVSAGFEAALERLRAAGVELVDVDWPTGEDAFPASTAIMFTEASALHRRSLADAGARYGIDVRTRLVQGAGFDPDSYVLARSAQVALRARCLAVLAGVDAVVGPTLPAVPPLLDEAVDPAVAARLVANTRLANLTGLPAVSVPVPGTVLPVGVQVEARSDGAALAAAALLEGVLLGS